jgi:hypothetical protein
LYVIVNPLDLPTNVMFFPQDANHFTAFDPASRALTHLEFTGADGQSLAFVLVGGRRVSAQRSARDR